MPIGEIETHPFLELGRIPNATKLILGSFPVYECTDPDNLVKQQTRNNEGTIRFFYGSVDSSFWTLYKTYVGNQLDIPFNSDNILTSLRENKISISDNIISCQRHDMSSEDSKLKGKNWNRQGLLEILGTTVIKILCTSKGVLSDLESKIVCPAFNGIGLLNVPMSTDFQSRFIEQIEGNPDLVMNPIARAYNINNRNVLALAIPSPGSPQRRLKNFGFNGQNWRQYLETYYSEAFDWFIN